MRSHRIQRDFWQIVMRNHWFDQIRCLLCQKSTDLSEKVAEIQKKNGRKLEKMVGIQKNCRILNGLRFGSGFTGFEIKNRQPTCQGRVSEVGTRIQPPESSDRVVAGCRFPWTPLTLYILFGVKLISICEYLNPMTMQVCIFSSFIIIIFILFIFFSVIIGFLSSCDFN